MSRWTLLLVGLVATLALLAAACGTAEEEDEEETTQPPEPTATAIVITGSAADPTATPEMDEPMDDPDTSVSGIPLDPDAKYGGVLQTSYTSNSPSFVPWESAAGHAFPVGHLINNMLIKPRTWGTREDYNNLAYFELHPDLATSWEQSKDGQAYTFQLRDGVNWSDGVRSRATISSGRLTQSDSSRMQGCPPAHARPTTWLSIQSSARMT